MTIEDKAGQAASQNAPDEGPRLEPFMDPAPEVAPTVTNAFRSVMLDNMALLEFYFFPPTADGDPLEGRSVKPVVRLGMTEHMAESVANTILELLQEVRKARAEGKEP